MAVNKLGNFAIKEIIRGVATNFNDELLYTLDQLTSASVEITAESTDITDKDGNIIRTIYNAKTGTFSATSALLSPALLNAQSGSEMEIATAENKIEMPAMLTVAPGSTTDIEGFKEGTVKVMGIYTNGANGAVLRQSTTAKLDETFKLEGNEVTVPGAGDGAPQQYLIMYNYDEEAGYKMSNFSNKFPDTIRLTLYVAVMDPCSDSYLAGYLYIPSFQPDPSVTINLDSENQEVDFNGNLQIDYCGDEGKVLSIELYKNNLIQTVAA